MQLQSTKIEELTGDFGGQREPCKMLEWRGRRSLLHKHKRLNLCQPNSKQTRDQISTPALPMTCNAACNVRRY